MYGSGVVLGNVGECAAMKREGGKMKYIKKIDQRDLYGDGIGKVALWDFARANENEESRIEAVATVASICYGKPPKDAKKLVERLWTESGGLPSSAFEFIRIGGLLSDIRHSLRNHPFSMPYFSLMADAKGIGVPSNARERLACQHRKDIATFKLKVPIFIARQVMRHRQFSYQELSRRYTTDKRVPLEFWKVKAGTAVSGMMENVLHDACDLYREIQAAGYKPEIARGVLPQSLYTEFWMMGDVPAWKNYFKLRLDQHTQKEHRELAIAMLDLLHKHQIDLWDKVAPGVVIDPSCDEEEEVKP